MLHSLFRSKKPVTIPIEVVEYLHAQGDINREDMVYLFEQKLIRSTGSSTNSSISSSTHPEDYLEAYKPAGNLDLDDAYHQLQGDVPAKKRANEVNRLVATSIAVATLAGTTYHFSRTDSFVQQPPLESIESTFSTVVSVAEPLAQPDAKRPAVATPAGYKTVQVSEGVTAYVAPGTAIDLPAPTVSADASSPTSEAEERIISGIDEIVSPLDGTRHPYLSEVRMDELMKNEIAPGRYQWRGIWRGEGYSRELDQVGQLVAEREGGADIHLTVTYDANIVKPDQPNLIITIKSNQDTTGQLTNLSAFLHDPQTGGAIARRDFEQLAPIYDVTLTMNGGFGGTETKTLDPLGTIAYQYHVPAEKMKGSFPIKLEAVNQLFDDRQWEIYTLQMQGWVIKEVPPPM